MVKECKRCVLNSNDDPNIVFDQEGICNHCRGYEQKAKVYDLPEAVKKKKLDEIIQKIKTEGKGKQYDCIIGISGGVDSSYLCYKVKEMGIRPLLVHFDNGWNSELAVKNIENILNKLQFDLYTYVVNWEEFKDLQLAYIKASVLDWEIPTDHGFWAMLHQQAYKHKIKYILSGHNIVTEGILPKNMRWNKWDVANIKDIYKHFGTSKLKTFPMLDFFTLIYYTKVMHFEFISPLNYLPYDKNEAKQVIQRELGWKDYGGKHYESIFTRFYQGYVLIEKFKVDKRKAHLATLINSKQMTKEEALEELKKPAYDPNQLREDKDFVLKKLGISESEFDAILKQPARSHLEFASYETGLYPRHEKFFTTIKPFTRLIKKINPLR